MKLCIVIPVHNEAQRLGPIVELLTRKNFFVVVIDDGSTDDSKAIAEQKGAYVISTGERHGKGFALQKGFEFAVKEGYDGVIAMDGDAQHAVEDLDVFLEKINEVPLSIINGNRMPSAEKMPLLRRVTNRFMSSLISWVCQQSIPDSQCGFRYISTEILKNISLSSQNFEIETEILIKASRKKYKILSVPIQTIYRGEASHIRPIQDSFRFFQYLFKELMNK